MMQTFGAEPKQKDYAVAPSVTVMLYDAEAQPARVSVHTTDRAFAVITFGQLTVYVPGVDAQNMEWLTNLEQAIQDARKAIQAHMDARNAPQAADEPAQDAPTLDSRQAQPEFSPMADDYGKEPEYHLEPAPTPDSDRC